MLQRIKGISFITIGIISLNACEHHPLIKPDLGLGGTKDSTTVSVKCDPDSVYFVNEILPLIVSKCASESGCHSAQDKEDGIQLDNYAKIMSTGEVKPGVPSDSKLYKQLLSQSKPMPPNGSLSGTLTQAQKDLVKKWIEQGANNNYCGSACDSSVYTYSAAIEKILKNNNCVTCHVSGNIPLSTYTQVKVVADDGRLIGAIKHEFGFQPMPSSNSTISDCEKKQIEKWIKDGAKNN